MRYSFSGHESFLCKALWLKKGYDFIYSGNNFTDADAVVKLGVGKNMVSSIKFWMKAFGLFDGENLTKIAHYIFNSEEGKDPFAEDINTLWLLHFLLIASEISSIYKIVFLDFQREKREFDKEQLQLFIKRKCNVPEQKNVYNENTVKKDIRVFLQNYHSPESPKSYEEYTGLLINLRLINRNEDKYYFSEITKDKINPIIIFFSLIYISNGDLTVSFDKLQELSLLFCIPIAQFLQIIRDLSIKFPKTLSYTDNSGIRNVQFLKEINIFYVLSKYYK